MARPYETVLIFDSALDEAQLGEKIQRFQNILSVDGRPAAEVVNWGKRKLAYPIGKREQGTYVILRYESDPAALNELERVTRLDEQILRHLTVVNPPEVNVVSAETAAGASRETRRDDGEE